MEKQSMLLIKHNLKEKEPLLPVVMKYGSASNQLAAPEDVHVDGAGNIYVLDGNNNRVQKWAPGATLAKLFAGGNGLGSGANQFFLPQVFLLIKQEIYVADLYNNRVKSGFPGNYRCNGCRR
jgi:hypothetical protein